MTNSDDIETQLERAGNYFMSGRFKRAAALYRSVLTQDPGNLRALSPMARIDAELGRTTMEEALTNLKELAAVHPDDEAPPRVMIGVLYRLQRWEECAVVRRALLDRYPESPVVLQMWANGLQVDPKTKSDPGTPAAAWEYYKKALESGPLRSTCFRSAAFIAGRKAEPSRASDAFLGASTIERLAIRTRTMGPKPMLFGLFAGFILGMLVSRVNLGLGTALQLLTLAWGVWCTYCNNLMCCKKCRNVWIVTIGMFAVLSVFVDYPKTWPIAVVVVGILILVMRRIAPTSVTSGSEVTESSGVGT